MKKSIVVILFSFFSFEVDAQTYPIPGAAQQRAWVFPFFIEDAHGNKDTVYIGKTFTKLLSCQYCFLLQKF